MSNWKHIRTVIDGEKFRLSGLHVWEHEWIPTEDSIVVKDPLYNQDHQMHVYQIKTENKTVKFAAGEFSNCVWGFYQEPKSQKFNPLNSKIKRNQITYLILILVTITAGLLSRTSIVPKIIYPYLGDFLYSLMFYFIFGFIFKKQSPLKITLLSIFFCYSIEILQLYQAVWINTVRTTKIGGLVLGYGFLWSDIISYTLGGGCRIYF